MSIRVPPEATMTLLVHPFALREENRRRRPGPIRRAAAALLDDQGFEHVPMPAAALCAGEK